MDSRSLGDIEYYAEFGEAWAQYQLAEYMYREGELEKAYQWYHKAADQNYGLAVYKLAMLLETGLGIEKNERYALTRYEQAFVLMKDSDEEEEHKACGDSIYRAGLLHLSRKERDYINTGLVSFLVAAHDFGHCIAGYKAAKMYYIVEDYEKALDELDIGIKNLKRVLFDKKEDDASEQTFFDKASYWNALSESYWLKYKIYKATNHKDAMKVLAEAVSLGHPLACHMIGNMYQEEGKIKKAIETYELVTEDLDRYKTMYKVHWGEVLDYKTDIDEYYEYAIKCHERKKMIVGMSDTTWSAEESDVKGDMKNLMNDREFIELQRKAKNGIAWAQYELGCFYEKEDSEEEAFFWYKKAADQGYGLAMYEVAEAYYFGSGTDENESKAISWYLDAVEKLKDTDEPWERECCAIAFYRLGKLHDQRFNIPEERVRFYEAAGQNIGLISINAYEEASKLGSGYAAHRLAVMYNVAEKYNVACKYADRAITLLEDEVEFSIKNGKVNRIAVAALADSYFVKSIALSKNVENGNSREAASFLGKASGHGHPIAAYLGIQLNAKENNIEGIKRCCENAITIFEVSSWRNVIDDIEIDSHLKALDLCEKIITNIINGDSIEEFLDCSCEIIYKRDFVKETVNDITHESIYQLSLIAKDGNKAAISELWRQIKMLVPDEDFTAEIYRKTAPFIIGIKLFADSRNSSEAHYHLATCYHYGNGVDKSYSQAKDLYERAINRIEIDKQGTVDILKASIKGLNALQKENGTEAEFVYPVTYGNSTFKDFDEIIDNIDTNPDALGLYSHCSIFGIGVVKRGTLGFDGLFEAANAGCTDAILGLGRLYEIGYDFIARDTNAALQLYKYAYSLKNVDALHSLGFVLFNSSNKKEIGLSMMQKAAELGSKDASNQLELLKEDIVDVKVIPFGDITKKEFEYDEFTVVDSMQLYSVNLQDKQAIKNAIVDVMENMKPDTYSAIMNQFRVKYLRRRKLMHFRTAVNFLAIFEELVKEGLVTAERVNDYGVVENTLYILKNSKQKMKSTTLDWDDL